VNSAFQLQSSGRSKILTHNKRKEVINMTSTKRGTQSLCIVLSILTYCTLSAQGEPPRIRNIVLVHGAWADGSGWKGVYDILVKDGFNVSIVQEPETSLKTMSRPQSVSSLNKMDRAFSSLIAMAAR
jgi:hypothetical protein